MSGEKVGGGPESAPKVEAQEKRELLDKMAEKLKANAEAQGFEIMVGCMLGTSLAMAPALLPAQGAAVVDLDGPLLLERDCEPGLRFEGAKIAPPTPDVWE